jgi:inhibitor of KinA
MNFKESYEIITVPEQGIEIIWDHFHQNPDFFERIAYVYQALKSEMKTYEAVEVSMIYNKISVICSLELVQQVKAHLKKSIDKSSGHKIESVHWKIPVFYESELAKDYAYLEEKLQLTRTEIKELHQSRTYTIYGIGFLPGFLYMGELNEKLNVSRKLNPDLHIESGSVGITGAQTGVYTVNSPGGWHIIGHCPIPFFNPSSENPAWAKPGDVVSFFEIDKNTYELIKIQVETTVFDIKEYLNDSI